LLKGKLREGSTGVLQQNETWNRISTQDGEAGYGTDEDIHGTPLFDGRFSQQTQHLKADN
jgi:hypothetical protein